MSLATQFCSSSQQSGYAASHLLNQTQATQMEKDMRESLQKKEDEFKV